MYDTPKGTCMNINASWHCLNCGKILTATLNEQGKAKTVCPLCHSEQIYHKLSRTHRRVDSYAPKNNGLNY
jgi:DNA-directed RNA polymerase subunit RPC12/RpoP